MLIKPNIPFDNNTSIRVFLDNYGKAFEEAQAEINRLNERINKQDEIIAIQNTKIELLTGLLSDGL